MLDLAFAAGSVSVFASMAVAPHVAPLMSALLTRIKNLFGAKPTVGERSGWRIEFDWGIKRFGMWSTREPAQSVPASTAPSPAVFEQQLPPIAAGCERLPQPPTPLVSEPEPILLYFPPPGHAWTIVVDPDITAHIVEQLRAPERSRPVRKAKRSSTPPARMRAA